MRASDESAAATLLCADRRREALLAEAASLLRPGGVFFGIAPDADAIEAPPPHPLTPIFSRMGLSLF